LSPNDFSHGTYTTHAHSIKLKYLQESDHFILAICQELFNTKKSMFFLCLCSGRHKL